MTVSGRTLDGAGAPALDDLFGRFASARRAALETTLGDRPGMLDELEAVESVPPERWDALLAAVFLNAWRLGRSAARRLNRPLDARAVAGLLGDAPSPPCLARPWLGDGEAQRATGAGCVAGVLSGRRVCDFFREAIDGLVCGLTDDVRYTRLASLGRGGESCEDRLYPASRPELRWGPVPPAIADELAALRERLAARGVELELLGVAENRLVVGTRRRGAPGDGASLRAAGAAQAIALVAARLRHRFPELEVEHFASRGLFESG